MTVGELRGAISLVEDDYEVKVMFITHAGMPDKEYSPLGISTDLGTPGTVRIRA